MPSHVADGKPDGAVRAAEGVVPVAPHLDPLLGGQVASREAQIFEVGQLVGQDCPLKDGGDPVLLLEEDRPLDGFTALAGEGEEEGPLLGVKGMLLAPRQGQGADDAPAGHEGQRC